VTGYRWASRHTDAGNIERRIANLFARESETDEEQEANQYGVSAIINAIVDLKRAWRI
jgi:hypothetical protein